MRWISTKGMVLLVWLFLASGCIVSEVPANVRRYQATRAARYPWTAEAIDEESKAHLCAALELDPHNPFCQPGAQMATADLMDVLRKRFPVNKTTYEEVAEVLQGFPGVLQKATNSEGELIYRRYAYLLTQFEGFCVYFYVDLVTNGITRIHNTKAPGVFDGPIRTRCGPAHFEPRRVGRNVGYYERPAWSSWNRWLAVFFTPEAGDQEVWAAHVPLYTSQQLTRFEGALESQVGLTWLPKGRRVAFVASSAVAPKGATEQHRSLGRLCLVDRETQEVECPYFLHDRWLPTGLSWHPTDSNLLAVVYRVDPNTAKDSDHVLALWRVGEGEPEPLLRERVIRDPAWSVQGDRLAYVIGSTNDSPPVIEILRVDTQERHRLERTVGFRPAGVSWSPDGRWLVFGGIAPRDPRQEPRLFVVATDGSRGPMRLPIGGLLAMEPAWALEGDLIAFTTVETPTNGLYVVDVPSEFRPKK